MHMYVPMVHPTVQSDVVAVALCQDGLITGKQEGTLTRSHIAVIKVLKGLKTVFGRHVLAPHLNV
jgi:hypothetical protein